jgi:hypothetical protein
VMLEETGVLAAFVISAAYRPCGFAIRPLKGTQTKLWLSPSVP